MVAVLVQSVRIVAENHFLRDGISGKEPAGISPAALLQTKKAPGNLRLRGPCPLTLYRAVGDHCFCFSRAM